MFNEIITKNNTDLSTTSGSYESIKYYDNNIMQKPFFPYQFDGWYDKKNYGIRYNNFVIYPKKSSLKTYVNDNKEKQQNLLFVVDAFKDMKIFIKDRVSREFIKNTSSIYSKLNVLESTTNVDYLYLKHLNVGINLFINSYVPAYVNNGITNIYDFAKHFAKFISIITKVAPFNRHLFIGSHLVPETINGLTISFESNLNPLNLVNKVNVYTSQEVFKNFTEMASRFGFVVDRNFPWRIVADLKSPAMKNYYSKYSLNSEEEVFEKLYHKAYLSDISSLKNVFITYWNRYVQQVSSISNSKDVVSCTNKFGEIVVLNFLDEELLERYFDINWQIRLYFYIRVMEENIKISQNKFDILHTNACKINKIYSIKNSIEYINEQILFLKDKIQEEKYYDLTNIETVDMVTKRIIQTAPSSTLIF